MIKPKSVTYRAASLSAILQLWPLVLDSIEYLTLHKYIRCQRRNTGTKGEGEVRRSPQAKISSQETEHQTWGNLSMGTAGKKCKEQGPKIGAVETQKEASLHQELRK